MKVALNSDSIGAIRCGTFFLLVAVVTITQYACISKGMDTQINQLIQEKDYRGAVDAYQSVIDSNPGTPEARQAQLGLAKLHIEKMNQPQQGVKVYQDLLATAPDSEEAAEAHWHLGVRAFKSEDYQSAQQSFDTIINKFPTSERGHNAQLMLAKSYEEASNYEKAAEVYDNVANRYPEGKRATQALVSKARIEQEDVRDIEAAVQTYQSIVKRYGNIEGTEELVGTARQQLRLMGATIPKPEDWSTTPLEQQRQRHERDRPQGRWERIPAMGEASDYSESAFGVDPEFIFHPWKSLMLQGIMSAGARNIPPYHILVLIFAYENFDFQNYRDAGALYFYAIKLAETQGVVIDSSAYFDLAACYRKLGMHQRGAEVLKQGAKKSFQLLEDIIWTGDNQYLAGNYNAAIETYSTVVGVNRSKDAVLYWKLGVVHQKMGNYAKEAENCERAIAIKPDYVDALQSLAYVLYYHLNDRDRSLIIEALANGNRGTYETEAELGAICYKHRNYTQAKRQYDTAARIAQRHRNDATIEAEQCRYSDQIVYARIHQATAAYQNGSIVDAQTWMDALTVEYPNHRLIPYGRGQMALLKGDVKTAISAFKIAIEKDPASDAAPIALCEYYLSQENPDAALRVFEGVLKTHPLNREVRRRFYALKRQQHTQTNSLKPTKKHKNFLPTKRRTIYPRNRIPRSQLPSAFFIGLSESQVIEKYGAPVAVLAPPPNLPNATKRFAYGALVQSISSTFSVEGEEFIFDENGVVEYRKVYFGDVNAWVGSAREHPALLDEIPDKLASTIYDVTNEQIIMANKYLLIVQKAQIVWELDSERWMATVYTTYPAEDRGSEQSINKYKPKLKDYRIMEILVTARNIPLNISLK